MPYVATCTCCGIEFTRPTRCHPKHHPKWKGKHFCSVKCRHLSQVTSITQPCGWCNKSVTRNLAEAKGSASGLLFCNNSCSASYSNTKRRKSRRSKCEVMLFDLLSKEFPNVTMLPNDKTMLDGLEVDIAIPDIQLAIEWNGIVHFKPIYGQSKLDRIQNIDKQKLEIAENKDINLIVIPDLVSKDEYVKEAFHKISSIIRELLKN